MNPKTRKKLTINGVSAAAEVAFNYSEVCAIYPISPSSGISEQIEIKSKNDELNIFNNKVDVYQMESEAGSVGALHGILQNGILSSTFTSSQGLLLMIPTIYKLRGELLPAVIYVVSRSLASRSLSIFGDHQDIYATRQTGVTIMCCHSVQQVMDLSPVAHAIAIEASAPVINFFDGYRTSNEVQNIDIYDKDDYKNFFNIEKLNEFRNNTLSPLDPVTRGSSEDESTYFQSLEAQNLHTNDIYKVAKKYFAIASELTGNLYAPFVYYGSDKATSIIIAMGSVTEALEEVVDTINSSNKEQVGIIKVYLYRPFNTNAITDLIPKTVEKIAILDRTKEFGSPGEPLYLDVVSATNEHKSKFAKSLLIIGGRYGLSSKNVSPQDLKGVFDHLNSKKPFHNFTIGINDDLTNLSIQPDLSFNVNEKSISYLFWGLSGDGMVSASVNIMNLIGENTKYNVQGYVMFDSRKAGGPTRNYIRFSKEKIRSTYYATNNDFIVCSKDNFLIKIKVLLETINFGGTVLLNTRMTPEELKLIIPNRVKKLLAERNVNFYIIDAQKISSNIGLGARINTIMQMAFFYLNKKTFLPYEETKTIMKKLAEKTYGKKGANVVEMNYKAIDSINESVLKKIEIDKAWINLKIANNKVLLKDYRKDFVEAVESMQGNDIPTSYFNQKIEGKNILDGTMLNDVSFGMKRQLANFVPKWIPENCIQCSQCVFYCPHATIRAFQLTDSEIANAPRPFDTLEQVNPNNKQYRFNIHIDAENCVGCGICATVCPGKGPDKKALVMTPANELAFKYQDLTDYLYKKVKYRADGYNTDSLKGASFLYPYLEDSGACAGCGETPYYKLLTQLFGKDMVIANATGCTSIFCGTYPFSSFTKDDEGQGPAWANSLFENNAQFGFGMVMASKYKRNEIRIIMNKNLSKVKKELGDLFSEYLVAPDREVERSLRTRIIDGIRDSENTEVKKIIQFCDVFVKKSHWIIGGDGWAYDIGYGGLDHILASGEDINVLVLDTEVYSNTGGHSSKASSFGSVNRFSSQGKLTMKKDICKIFMSYQNIYIAKTCLGMNSSQTIKAFKEAEAYNGPSIIVCYCPCIEHGIKGGLSQSKTQEINAVMSGYWPIFRYNPSLIGKNINPFILDYKNPNFDKLKNFLMSENRFAILWKKDPANAELLLEELKANLKSRFNSLKSEANIIY